MTENETRVVAEEWLNDIIEELSEDSFNIIKKAVYGDTTVIEEFSRNEGLIFKFIQDFYKFWGSLPSVIEKNF